MSINKKYFSILLLFVLAGEFFAAPLRFFDGEKFRELQTIQDSCGVQFFYNTQYFNLYFSPQTTAALKTAYEKYIADFEGKKLSRNSKKTTAKYGEFSARIEWGTSRQNMKAFADNAAASFGYAFAQGSPYFVISVKSAQSQNSLENPAFAVSGDVKLFFTKAQIAELVAALEQ